MLRRHFLFNIPAYAAGLACLTATPTQALSLESASAHLQLDVPQTEGALDWSLLALAGQSRLQDGMVSRFPAVVRALENHEVMLFGFMMPFRNGAMHMDFLLGGLQFHCPSCMAGDLKRLVAVRAAQPIPYVEEPVLIRGTLRLLEDEQSPLFYRLENARAA